MEMTEEIQKDDVRLRAEFAKLDRSGLLQPVQLLKFDEEASDQNVMLLQMDKKMLEKVEAGEELIIRGGSDDAAVLCTEDATYDLKKAMSSNTMILLEKCITNKDDLHPYSGDDTEETETIHRHAFGWSFTYMELKQIYPRITRLLTLLKRCPYMGPEHEHEADPTKMYTLTELINIIQASESEVMQFLIKFNSCCINGRWRLFDFGYIVECMGQIFQVIESESWNCGKVPVVQLCEIINDSGELVPSFVVKHLLSSYGTEFKSEDDGLIYAKLDECKVSRFFAEMLLKDIGKFHLSEFIEVWKESMPAGMVADEGHLKGLALTDTTSQPPSIKLFKSEDLSIDVEQRFDALFHAKEKWEFGEIVPYIKDVCLDELSVTSTLTKHARASTGKDGTKLFSSRKPLT
uniref:Sister chromatid cohesion protein DCC1 n=1 Tax=Phallusia mammillata TaxID=59560 RepID=A0A6F9DC07_9ASCI|nr:sister chromatid cohesion protein DCC1-like [Phallusia mammillata]